MGLREDLIADWTNKHITYQGYNMFVVKQIEHDGITYLYAIDKDDAVKEDKKDLNVAFLYKVKDDVWANVDDDDLFDELMGQVAGELTGDLLKKHLK